MKYLLIPFMAIMVIYAATVAVGCSLLDEVRSMVRRTGFYLAVLAGVAVALAALYLESKGHSFEGFLIGSIGIAGTWIVVFCLIKLPTKEDDNGNQT